VNEEQAKALETKYRRVAFVSWEGHEIVFRRPTRDEWHAYQRRRANPVEAPAAVETHAQITLAAFDGIVDPRQARERFTNEFLEDFPGFCNAPEVGAALGALAGTAQEEELAGIKKVVQFRPIIRPNTPAASPNGSPTAVTPTASSQVGAALQQS
jgi:hypothetical protein